MKGMIKTLSKKRGFGFIKNEHGEDVFFHRSNLESTSFYNLCEGDRVEFTLEKGKKGFRTEDIRIVRSTKNDKELTRSTLEKLKDFFNIKYNL